MKISIASGKGGTGKTTLSVNLAAMISQTYLEVETVLTDLDVEEPNSGLFLHGETLDQRAVSREIPEWIQQKCTLCGICRDEGIDVIGRIPNMTEIAKKYSRGEMIWEIPQVKEQMAAILENISQTSGPPIIPGQKKQG